MIKKAIIILIILFIVGISGCTIKNSVNETFGEKKPVGAESLFIINSTGEHYDRNGTIYYYVWGYIGNNGGELSKSVNITVKVVDENNKLIATNSTIDLRPGNIIQPQGNSYFYVRFSDSKKIIANYTINIATY